MKNTKETMRLNKFLAQMGLCSRREADTLIEKGWVTIDGKVPPPTGQKVELNQEVQLSQDAQNWLQKKITLVIHKPPGYVSNLAEEGHKHVMDIVTRENFFGETKPKKVPTKGFAPAGRLDIDSTGLLLLTQDGTLAKKVIQPNSAIEKEYIVKVDGRITDEKLQILGSGTLKIDGKVLKTAEIHRINETQLRIVLREGKKRQIRKMCELCDLRVMTLKRIRIGSLKLGDLPRGMWRFLERDEII